MRKLMHVRSNGFMINSDLSPHIFENVGISEYVDYNSNKTFYYIAGCCGSKTLDGYTAAKLGLSLRKYREIVMNKGVYYLIPYGEEIFFLELKWAERALEQLISYFVLETLCE